MEAAKNTGAAFEMSQAQVLPIFITLKLGCTQKRK